MRIVIAGCGRVGSVLATRLAESGHDVTVIDKDVAALKRLGKAFNGTTVAGMAYDVDVQRRAGIELAEVFAAVTDSDNANLMAVEVAKAVFGVKRAIARLYDPAREPSYRALNVQHVTGTKLIAQVIFEQIVDEGFQYHLTFPAGDVEIVEFILSPAAAGITIADLQIPNLLRVAAVSRAGVTHIPHEGMTLQPGDLVVAAARAGVRQRVARFLQPEEG